MDERAQATSLNERGPRTAKEKGASRSSARNVALQWRPPHCIQRVERNPFSCLIPSECMCLSNRFSVSTATGV